MSAADDSWLDVHVVERQSLTPDVFGFWLARPDGPLPPFEAGDHIDVELEPGLVRQYSLCNPPDGSGRYRLGVLREPEGRGGSRALCDGFGVGSRLRISAPRHRFPLVEDASFTALFAGGIGITPLLAMAWRLHALGRPFTLHYAFRSASRAAFVDELTQAPFADRVQLHADDGTAGCPLDLASSTAYTPGAHLYTCGPAGFMAAVHTAAAAGGWPEDARHQESFTAAPVEPLATDGSFEVELRKSGVTLRVGPDETVAEAARRRGLQPLLSCESGICGTCLTPVLAGLPDHRDHYLTPDEHAANDVMAICCSRAKSQRLVLDL